MSTRGMELLKDESEQEIKNDDFEHTKSAKVGEEHVENMGQPNLFGRILNTAKDTVRGASTYVKKKAGF